jgi:superfamily I DNA/RNA helicase
LPYPLNSITASYWETGKKGNFCPKTCIIASKNKIINSLKTHFEHTGLNCTVLKHDQLDEDKPEILRLSTMHRAKGLEFDQVIVILDNTIPLDVDDEDNTPNLIYVSLTRARSLAALIELR